VPTTAELGQPRLLSSTWFAVLAPRGTPAAVVERLNAVANEVLADAGVRRRLSEMGATPLGGTPRQLAEHLAAETDKWAQVVREARIQAQ
jgi:tripartite-type tricarboxylate transporter receptor subunit TctC